MKNLFTGILAFIVYSGLCLTLYHYLIADPDSGVPAAKMVTEDIVEEPIIDEQPFIDSTPPTLDETLEETVENNLIKELDSIAKLKLSYSESALESVSDSIVLNDNSIQTEAVSLDPAKKDTSVYEASPFILKDKNGDALSNCTTFTTIYKNNSKVKIPYTCRDYGNDLKSILSSNPKAQVILNGYSSSEEGAGMGLKRAEYVQKLLSNIGIKKDQIVVKGSEKNIIFNSGIAQGGIDITIINIAKSDHSNNKPTDKVTPIENPKPTPDQGTSGPYGYKRFTSGYQGDFFYGNRSFTAYIKELKGYLNSNPTKKVYVYAYTDTVGNATDNYNIGKDNVNTAKRLMIQNGIPSNRIVAVSKGEQSSGAAGGNRSIAVIVK